MLVINIKGFCFNLLIDILNICYERKIKIKKRKRKNEVWILEICRGGRKVTHIHNSNIRKSSEFLNCIFYFSYSDLCIQIDIISRRTFSNALN